MISTLLVALSAGLLALSFSSFNLWIFAWCAFIPFFFALRNKGRLRAFFIAYLGGFIFWSLSIYWLIHVTLLGLFILIFYLSLYFGAFGFLYSISDKFSPLRRMFFLSSAWVLLEYLRSSLFTGFPWSLLGYSQYTNPILIQLADITGAWGVSFLLIFINYATFFLLSWGKKSGAKIILIPAAILITCLLYGFYKVNFSAQVKGKPVKISVIQGNIPQELKWDEAARDYIFQAYKELTLKASEDKPGLIIWPEASAPGLFGEDDKLFQDIFTLAKNAKANLLLGAVSINRQDYFNSALLVDSSGNLNGLYHKLHLVPFGEYIPLKKFFPFLQTIVPIGDIKAGSRHTIFSKPDKFAVLICFEDLFPELSRTFVKQGALFLVNITNDAWYKQSSAANQHLAASVFRAVENRVYLARAANTGISCFISPQGKVISIVKQGDKEIFVPGFRTGSIFLTAHQPTFYNRFGDFFVFACLIFALYGLFLEKRLSLFFFFARLKISSVIK